MLADLESLEKRVPNLVKKAQQGDKESKIQASVLGQALELLRDSKPARLTDPRTMREARARLAHCSPPTDPLRLQRRRGRRRLRNAKRAVFERPGGGRNTVIISAAIERRSHHAAGTDGVPLRSGLTETGLTRLPAGYDLLHLITFFTAGPKEARAWTVEKAPGRPRPPAPSTVIRARFIRAETSPLRTSSLQRRSRRQGSGKMRARQGLCRPDGTSCYSASSLIATPLRRRQRRMRSRGRSSGCRRRCGAPSHRFERAATRPAPPGTGEISPPVPEAVHRSDRGCVADWRAVEAEIENALPRGARQIVSVGQPREGSNMIGLSTVCSARELLLEQGVELPPVSS